LATKGVVVEFLCPADVCRVYRKKFPHAPAPRIPVRQP
jgi:hypothetical protein